MHILYLQWDNAMTRDCSLNFPKITSSEKVVFKNCFFFVLKFNEQSLVILWVNRFKNESFWHRFIFIKAGKNCHQLWFFITMIFTALFLKLKIIPIFEVVGLFLINVQSRAFFFVNAPASNCFNLQGFFQILFKRHIAELIFEL